jgi:hypothetical protein
VNSQLHRRLIDPTLKAYMKAQFKIKAILIIALGILGTVNPAHAMKLAVSADYPVAAGTSGQGFSSNAGASLSLYLDPLLDPKINNFISAGYRSFTIRADGESAYRIIPVLVGLELPGKVSEEVKVNFAAAVGGSVTYVSVPNSSTTQTTTYFTAQIKPGIEWDVAQDFAIRADVPITYLIASKSFSFLAYALGIQYDFGGSNSNQGDKR